MRKSKRVLFAISSRFAIPQHFYLRLKHVEEVELRGVQMINVTSVSVNHKAFMGLKVDLPESPPLLLIVGEKGFVMCGFLNVEAAEKLAVPAAMVSGVKTFEDVLNAPVKATTTKASSLGIKTGMKASEALDRMS